MQRSFSTPNLRIHIRTNIQVLLNGFGVSTATASWIEMSGCCIGMAFVFCNCFGTHPTSTTAAIVISSCFISLQLLLIIFCFCH